MVYCSPLLVINFNSSFSLIIDGIPLFVINFNSSFSLIINGIPLLTINSHSSVRLSFYCIPLLVINSHSSVRLSFYCIPLLVINFSPSCCLLLQCAPQLFVSLYSLVPLILYHRSHDVHDSLYNYVVSIDKLLVASVSCVNTILNVTLCLFRDGNVNTVLYSFLVKPTNRAHLVSLAIKARILHNHSLALVQGTLLPILAVPLVDEQSLALFKNLPIVHICNHWDATCLEALVLGIVGGKPYLS